MKFWCAVVVYGQRDLEPEDVEAYQVLLTSQQVQRIYLDELQATNQKLSLGIVKLVVESEETAVALGRELMPKLLFQNIWLINAASLLRRCGTYQA